MFFNGTLGKVTCCKWTPYLHQDGKLGQTTIHPPSHPFDPPYILIEVDPYLLLPASGHELLETVVHEAAHAFTLAHCIRFKWLGLDQRRIDFVLNATHPGGHGTAWRAIMTVLQEKLRFFLGEAFDLRIDES